MRTIVIALCILLAIAYVSAVPVTPNVHRKFYEFQVKYAKSYDTAAEKAHRVQVFAENLKRVELMNAEQDEPVFGITKFMDLTPVEFKKYYLNFQVPAELPKLETVEVEESDALPTYWDWRYNATDGVAVGQVITPVKDQQQCGSCWAFSATESIEAAWVIAGNKQAILGPQQIVDCDTVDAGCDGGYPTNAFDYVIKAGGQMTEEAYPYKAVDGNCVFKKTDIAASITAWKYVSQAAGGETKMANYVASTGPLSVCVDASSWQFYSGGVLKTCTKNIDHAVQATGFSEMGGIPVWHVRNSWGGDWGESGYIYLERGVNMCDIATIVAAAEA